MPPSTFQAERLRKHADYALVYGASRRHTSPSFAYFYQQSTGACRIGITVPRALGGAVVRNRIKRRVRVAARLALPELPPGCDVVLHPRPAVASMPFTALLAELHAAFARVASRIRSHAENTPQPRSGGDKRSRQGKPSARRAPPATLPARAPGKAPGKAQRPTPHSKP